MIATLRRFGAIAVAFATAAIILAAPSKAQDEGATYIFLVTVADRGLNCGLMADWEVAALLSETDRILLRFGAGDQQALIDAATQQAAATPCDDPQINEWIAGARPGMEREWLPPNLALFRAFAALEAPPQLFVDIVGDTDLAAAVATIDAKLDAFEAAGITAEGERTWDEYIAEVAEVAIDVAAAAGGATDTDFPPDIATEYVIDAGLITVLWLADQ